MRQTAWREDIVDPNTGMQARADTSRKVCFYSDCDEYKQKARTIRKENSKTYQSLRQKIKEEIQKNTEDDTLGQNGGKHADRPTRNKAHTIYTQTR